MTVARGASMAAVTVGLVLAIVGMSQLPASLAEIDDALLRLSWRVAGVAIEECHTLTPEELEALPAHMRRSEVCTGRNAEYLLRVQVDAELLVQDTIRPAGARRDRPLYVFRDLPLLPGVRDVRVSFDAIVPPGFEEGDQPLSYDWSGSVTLASGEIALLTLAPETSMLVRVEGGD